LHEVVKRLPDVCTGREAFSKGFLTVARGPGEFAPDAGSSQPGLMAPAGRGRKALAFALIYGVERDDASVLLEAHEASVTKN